MRFPCFRCFAIAIFLASGSSFSQSNVWMLTPGFTVRELPIKISNINNLRFTPDGKLTALGYDGRVHILRDTNGDGIEDEDTLFWDKQTISVPVGMVWSSNGLYVSSHGKVSLLRDTNGDGVADLEEIIATNWPPTDVGSGGVDATAVTLDQKGNLYFGLLTADYSNPYRVKDGVSHYDLKGKRGTIQKFSMADKRMETIATGIRVPYTLAFNRAGDLFVTDQEGETWCPGGNPLDELNYIIPGRNYGFPPREPKYLPNLISEPPVVGFGPQHQSSCGMVFNEPAKMQKLFGPAWWMDNAFVAGESRGKIWRVTLVKTPFGYIGKETLIARLNMLTMDVAISPNGDLYVSCHSGLPDWGTGPQGQGKIFKISYIDREAPQATAIWASSSMEVSVAFDKAIDPEITKRFGEMRIEFGEYVAAADRYEVLKPPYRAVQLQEATPRGKLRVVSAQLTVDHRTLLLATDPHPQSVHYALTLPGVKRDAPDATPVTIDLAYDLSGVEVRWFDQSNASSPKWSGWLTHLDSEVNKAFTVLSAEHEKLVGLLRQPGRLELRTQLALPAGKTRFHVEGATPFTVTLATQTRKAESKSADRYSAEIIFDSGDKPAPLEIKLETGVKNLAFESSYSSEADPTVRSLPIGMLLLPWAPPHQDPGSLSGQTKEFALGDFESGRGLFTGETLKCASCHRLRGEGATVGPDLSNLVHRDAASVLRDIKDPNATINPDYVAYNVRLRNGNEITGFVRAQTTDSLRVSGADGKEQFIERKDVKDMRPSAVSLMPSGLLEGLEENQVLDLMTFLMHEPPRRTPSEVAGVLKASARALDDSAPKALKIVLIASKQDHGPDQHDYPAWQKKWKALLAEMPGVTVSEAWEWPDADQWRQADEMVFYFWNHDWSADRYRQLDDYQARGGAVAVFHAATIADKDPEKLAERIGLAAQPGPTKYRHTPLTLRFVAPMNDSITAGFKDLNLLDEPYWPMFGDTNRITLLAAAEVDSQPRPLIWTFQKGKGRVFASILGHYSWTFDDPMFRVLALRGMAWAMGEPVDRLRERAGRPQENSK